MRARHGRAARSRSPGALDLGELARADRAARGCSSPTTAARPIWRRRWHAGGRSLRADQSAAHALAGAGARAEPRRGVPQLPEEPLPARPSRLPARRRRREAVVDAALELLARRRRRTRPGTAVRRSRRHDHPRASTRRSTIGGRARARRPRRRRGRGGALHAHQARQAAGAVLGLGAAVQRDRLLPAPRPASTLAEVDHVAYSFDPPRFAGDDRSPRRRRSTLPMRPRPRAHPGESWESPWDPLFASLPAATRRGNSSTARRTTSRARFAGVTRAGRPYRLHFVDHHLSHQASAFLAAPFERCAVMTLDGRGEERDDRPTAPARRDGALGYARSARSRCRTRWACSTRGSPATSASCIRATSTR